MTTGQMLEQNLSATEPVRPHTLQLLVGAYQEQVGAAIRRRRHAIKMSPGDFAQAMNIAGKTLERWERGETGGALLEIDKVAEVLKTPAETLLCTPADKDAGTPDLMALPTNGSAPEPELAEVKAQIEASLAKVQDDLEALATAQEQGFRDLAEQLHGIAGTGKKKGSGAKKAS